MRLVSNEICPFVQRVAALLEAKELSYEIQPIELSEKPAWFLDSSPNGQVPILFTGEGHALFESDAIVEFVEETSDLPLYSEDPVQRAQERAWGRLATNHYLAQCAAQRSPDAPTLKERARVLDAAFEKMESRLDPSKFFGGDTVGMLEISWLPLLHRAATVERWSGYDFLAGFPRLAEWQAALLESGLPNRSISRQFHERFASFYLSDETHLGRIARIRQRNASEKQSALRRNAECCGAGR